METVEEIEIEDSTYIVSPEVMNHEDEEGNSNESAVITIQRAIRERLEKKRSSGDLIDENTLPIANSDTNESAVITMQRVIRGGLDRKRSKSYMDTALATTATSAPTPSPHVDESAVITIQRVIRGGLDRKRSRGASDFPSLGSNSIEVQAL
jgi:IQ calmodulin-binding motif